MKSLFANARNSLAETLFFGGLTAVLLPLWLWHWLAGLVAVGLILIWVGLGIVKRKDNES